LQLKINSKEQLQKLQYILNSWGNEFYYKLSENNKTYFIGSAGKDAIFNGFDQKGRYFVLSMIDFNKDIIYSNGQFVYSPDLK